MKEFVIRNGVLKEYNGRHDVTEVTIPSNVTEIESSVFAYRRELTKVIIPDSVTRIKGTYLTCGAFESCTGLRSVRLPERITEIGLSAFRDCTNLTLSLPDSLAEVGRYAFLNCRLVTYRGIPLPKDPEELTEITEILAFIRDRNFSLRMRLAVKYEVLWSMFCQNPEDADVFAYIKKNFSKMFQFVIEKGHMETAEAVCKQGKLLTRRNIDKFLEYAIEQGQTELQLLLLNYKNEKIGYGKNRFQL